MASLSTRPKPAPATTTCAPQPRFATRKPSVEIDPLLLDHQGKAATVLQNEADIFADQAEGDQLHRTEEEGGDQEWRDAGGESAPEDQLVDEIAQPYQQAPRR